MERNGIVVVGSLNVDYVANLYSLPGPGETVKGPEDGFAVNFGGKGGNSACMAALFHRHEGAVSMIGRVGEDGQGQAYVKSLAAKGVNVSHVIVDETNTGTATIFVGGDGENMIGINAGANANLSPDDLKEDLPVWNTAKIMLLQNEIPIETTLAALKLADAKGIISIFNPAPFTDDVAECLRWADFVIVNEHEVKLLRQMSDNVLREKVPGPSSPAREGAGKKPRALNFKSSLSHDTTSGELDVAPLRWWGIQKCIITRGDKGCIVWDESSGGGCFSTIDDVVHFGSPVDTTGAGDAFVGAFATSLCCYSGVNKHHSDINLSVMLDAARIAGDVASATVIKHGAQKSYPTHDDLEKLIVPQPKALGRFKQHFPKWVPSGSR